MQQRNVLTLEYLDDCERIADYVYVVFLNENQAVQAEDIQELDTGRRSICKRWGKIHTPILTRDILRKVILGS